jgi:hypothetical protein
MDACNQRLKEHRDDFCEGWTVFPQAPTNTTVQGANSIRRFNALSGGDSSYATDLVASNRSGQKQSCLKDGGVGSSLEQEKWPFHQKWGPAVQVVHPFQDGLRLPHMEIRFCVSTVACFRLAVWARNLDSHPTKIYPK